MLPAVMSLFASASSATLTLATPVWRVKNQSFAAVCMGLGFRNDTHGWTTLTSGIAPLQIVGSSDGGKSWQLPVTDERPVVLVVGLATAKPPAPLAISTTGLLSSRYSTDGATFNVSKHATFTPNSIRAARDGRMVVAGEDSVCVSSDGGASYACHHVPLLNSGTGRDAVSPAPGVLYMSAGAWPVQHGQGRRVSERGARLKDGRLRDRLDDGYTAELWRSTDDGATWDLLHNSSGTFYFTSIDCFDKLTCVATAEGFGKASSSPGAFVFASTDGKTFRQVHKETAVGASLIDAQMLSKEEHWAAGNLGDAASAPALALHSMDGGKSYANEAGGLQGQYIQTLDFVSPSHGYAVAINQHGLCSLLEYS